jgi:hypothetical protein
VIELPDAREDAGPQLAETGVDLLLELRDEDHADRLTRRLSAAGYPSRRPQSGRVRFVLGAAGARERRLRKSATCQRAP